jgi:HK97 family phage major capsid protein
MTESARMTELKSALMGQLAIIEEGTSRPDVIKVDGNNVEVSKKDAGTIRAAMENVNEIKMLMEAEIMGPELKAWMENPSLASSAVAANAVAQQFGQMPNMPQMKSLGVAFTDSEEFKELLEGGGFTMRQPYELDTFDVASQGWGKKDVYTALGSHNVAMGVGTRVQFDPMVPRGQRTARVRDLFPVATTSASLIDYFKVTGFAENGGAGNAQTVAERTGDNTNFGLKPKSSLQFTAAQAPVRTIAHWEAAHRNTLQDQPQLQSTINNELLYGLALEEDDQILNGDGTNENLLGILNTPGIQTYTQQDIDPTATVTYEPKSDALRRAATKAVLAYFPPTGYVVHPNDWEDVELQKGNDGQYMLVANVAIGMSAQIWRLPVVETPAMPEGTFLTGAFGTGAQLYDRARASVRIAEQHADFFVRNAIAILVEERIALAVKRPESFVKGTFLA